MCLMFINVCGGAGPLVGGLANKLGCRVVTVCGSVLAASSIAVSSLSSHVNHLIATYGLLAGTTCNSQSVYTSHGSIEVSQDGTDDIITLTNQ